jgi:4-amino-4-deoxy-L-arabinose transferase-like glycosyltransferase
VKAESGRSGRNERLLLAGILLGALAFRLGVFLAVYAEDPTRILTADSMSYVDSARALVQVGRFALAPDLPDVPQTVRTPGYPLFIAGLYAIFGERHAPVILAQLVVSVATVGLVYLIGVRFWGATAATMAILILALDYTTFLYSQLLLTETLFTFALVLTVWIAIRFLLAEQRRPRYALYLGLGLALQALIRPISYYLIFVILPGVLLIGTRSRWKRKELATVSLLILLPWVLLVGGWQVRNWLETGSWEFSHIRGVNLLAYRGADIVAKRDGISLEAARQSIQETIGDTEGMSEGERSELFARKGLELIRRYPLLFAQSQLQGAAKMMLVPGEGGLLEYLGMPPGDEGALGDVLRLSIPDYLHKWLVGRSIQFLIFMAAGLYLVGLYGLAAGGVWHSLVRDRFQRFAHLLVLGIILYFVVVSAGPEAYARFRVPIMPFLVLYAGRGVARVADRLGARRTGAERPISRPIGVGAVGPQTGIPDMVEEEGNGG